MLRIVAAQSILYYILSSTSILQFPTMQTETRETRYGDGNAGCYLQYRNS